ncbi:MAG: hypothetical protein KJO11_14655 [Gemmatimonadetes bacterium]|nr:hypothetical protein [Gemmatimonadota bacterium]
MRTRGSSLYPIPPDPALRPTPRVRGLAPAEALARLEWPVRLTALLMVAVPVVDLLLASSPALPGDSGWRLAVASSLPGNLLLPCLGTVLLGVLAVVRPSHPTRILALMAVASGIFLGSFAVGTLTRDLVYVAAAGGTPGAIALWTPFLGLLTIAAHLGAGWGVLMHGSTGGLPLAPPPGLHRLGIDLLD